MKNTIKRGQSPNLFEALLNVSILRSAGAKNLTCLCLLTAFLFTGTGNSFKPEDQSGTAGEDKLSKLDKFLITKDELTLKLKYENPEKKIAFHHFKGDYQTWKKEALSKLTELIAYTPPGARNVSELRTTIMDGITYHALVMQVSPDLTIPAYLLVPEGEIRGAVMAIQGHGSVENVIGLEEDYHHKFGYELAKNGYLVIAPTLRGFSTLSDLAEQTPVDRLDYWVTYSQFTLVTHLNLYGETLIGKTIEDLIAWEDWVCTNYRFGKIDVAGISYGGDLALYYPVFSKRVNKIFSSGSLGSFNLIFSRCYNAPAHGIPGVLKWLDRSDIAGLNAPRPILLHYGELDIPSETNYSASNNESVGQSVKELKDIYAREHAEDKISLHVTPNIHHEMDVELLKAFLNNAGDQ